MTHARTEEPVAVTVDGYAVVATASGLHHLGPSHHVEFPDRWVAFVRAQQGRLWAIVDRTEIWSSDESGRWGLVADSRGIGLSCLGFAADVVLAGGEDSSLLYLEDGVLQPLERWDAAATRERWFTPWGGPPDIRSIGTGDAGIFVNVHVGGILRSTDPFGEWRQTVDLEWDVHEVVAAGSDVHAAAAVGLITSRDSGDSWEVIDEGLHATYCRAVRPVGNDVLVTASVGPHAGRAGVYLLREGAEALEKCEEGLPQWFSDNIDTGCLDAAGDAAAFATSDGRVYLSEDGGESWQEVASSLPPPTSLVLG